MEHNEDQILRVYYRKAGTQDSQERTRNRIHWIINNAKGKRVCDIGCSQGLVSILLAREGFEVVGMDISPDAIAFAQKQAGDEPEDVRSRIVFVNKDAGELEPETEKFDTVIMGEILEHQSHPERLLSSAHNLLKKQGRAVITVPFGLHPDVDHKQEFYLSDILALLADGWTPMEIFIQDKFIHVIAESVARTKPNENVDFNHDVAIWTKKQEKAFLEAEKDYRRQILDLRSMYNALQKKYSLLQIDLEKKSNRLSQLTKSLELMSQQVLASEPASQLLRLLPTPDDADPAELLPSFIQKITGAYDQALDTLKNNEHEVLTLQSRNEALENQLRDVEKKGFVFEKKLTAQEEQIRHKEWLIKQKDQSIESKNTTVQMLKSQLADTKSKNDRLKKEIKKLRNEIRYKLGDVIVSSMYNPVRIPALPVEITDLFIKGLAKIGRRRKNRKRKKEKSRQAPTLYKKDKQPPAAIAVSKAPSALVVDKKQRLFPPIAHDKLGISVACVLDEFSYENFRHDCDLHPLLVDKWQQQLEQKKFDFLLVESAWYGNKGQWQYKITYKKPRDDNPLFELLAFCRNKNIPTVFWNKEDPTNYDLFIDAAKRFDWIFTTDENCISKYKNDAPDAKVFVLPFAAQPAIQNPVNSLTYGKLGDICFAGAWYPRHPERFEDVKMLIEASRKYDLHIYDRYLHHPQHDRYTFPQDYQKYIKGSLSFEKMVEVYRLYDIFLNVNSVKNSPSMFSRRVFEILACNTAVVSGYARGIEDTFGTDVVPMVRSTNEALETINHLMLNPMEREKLVLRGQREVFSRHTYRHRLQKICDKLEIDTNGPGNFVSVITATIRKDFVTNLLENFKRQTYPRKELLVIINEGSGVSQQYILDQADTMSIDNVRVIVVAKDTTLGSCLNHGVSEARGTLFAKMDDDDYYGAHYLEDSIQALNYSGADCVGKASYFTYVLTDDCIYLRDGQKQHRIVDFVIGTTLVAHKSIFPEVSFGDTRVGEDTIFLKRLNEAGKKLYSHSQYNYVKFYSGSTEHHTWKIERDHYLKNTIKISGGKDYDLCCC